MSTDQPQPERSRYQLPEGVEPDYVYMEVPSAIGPWEVYERIVHVPEVTQSLWPIKPNDEDTQGRAT